MNTLLNLCINANHANIAACKLTNLGFRVVMPKPGHTCFVVKVSNDVNCSVAYCSRQPADSYTDTPVETALVDNNHKFINDEALGYGNTIIQHSNFFELCDEIERLMTHYGVYVCY